MPAGTRSAFTLIELLVVIGIIGMLLAMGIPALFTAARRADLYATVNIISNVHTSVYQVARSEVGDRHIRYGYSLSALGVKPFFQCWQQYDAGAPPNPSRAYSLESAQYDSYLFPRSNTTGRHLVGKAYNWNISDPSGTRPDTILFEERGSTLISDARVGSPATLPLTKNRLDQSLPSQRMHYMPSESGRGFSAAPADIASLNVEFEPATGFTDAMIGKNGAVVARGSCAEAYLFCGSAAFAASGTPLAAHARYRIYIHPTGLLQISMASE